MKAQELLDQIASEIRSERHDNTVMDDLIYAFCDEIGLTTEDWSEILKN